MSHQLSEPSDTQLSAQVYLKNKRELEQAKAMRPYSPRPHLCPHPREILLIENSRTPKLRRPL